ncbi:MAG: hypothetical protein EBZ77_10905 [Chitinophagia bacterium]|nr:hypothetical protein [Chitinophagia bacterium]
MKHTIRQSIFAGILALATATILIGNQSCTPKDACATSFLADLAINTIAAAFNSQSSDYAYYTLTHNIINTVEHSTCSNCSNELPSGKNAPYYTEMYYSSSPTPGSWNNKVGSFPSLLNPIQGCGSTEFNEKFKFTKDGYYLIKGLVNLMQVVQNGVTYPTVPESYTNNNAYDKTWNARTPVNLQNDTAHVLYTRDGIVIHVYGLKNGGTAEPGVELISREKVY